MHVVAWRFAAVRVRTSTAKRFKKVDRATAIIWRLLQTAGSALDRASWQP
jgi:hypothetical protein